MQGKFQELLRFAQFTYHNYRDDGCRERAGSLTYLSLFALVPLLTVVYTMASAVPAFQGLEVQMQEFIFGS